MDHESFEPLGRWEVDRGPQQLAYDGWWHLGYDTMVTSEWGTPDTFENGLVPEVLLGAKYGHRLHFWDLHKRKHLQEIDFGAEHQLVFELRPAHDPTKAYGFVNCVISLEGSLLLDLDLVPRRRPMGGQEDHRRSRPSRPSPDDLPPLLKGFKAVPPLVTDIDLSMDDRFLYVSCWGTGDLQQYDVSDPFEPEAHRQGADRRDRRRGPRIRARRTGISTAARRWSRSAATARASTSPTRSTARSTRNSIQSGIRRLDGEARRRTRTAASRSIRTSSSNGRRATCRIRSGWKAATARPIRTAIREGGAARLRRSAVSACPLSWPWLALAGLGAFHGLNPAWAGCLPSRWACTAKADASVLLSLAPIALGHAAAIAAVVLGPCWRWAASLDHAALSAGAGLLLIELGRYGTRSMAIASACGRHANRARAGWRRGRF